MIIEVNFSEEFTFFLRDLVPRVGAEKAVEFLVNEGYDPDAARVQVRRVVRSMVAR